MGIQGLLPFLEKSSKRTNIKEFSGCTVAIDAYCWLHKGAFACSDKLVLNEQTDVYINYCMKFVNMLLSHNIKPILVFDGQHLPAKALTEKKRRETRDISRKKGAELLRAGRVDEARQHLRRAVDITHDMALNVIKECRRRNVDCIVAPYEADAQLAYLNMKNIAHVIITEDSDLMLFGSLRVMFKMDIIGNGILIEQDKLYLSMNIRNDLFNNDKFRYMCILSGCDYLPSLPGIGLKKACKFINRTSDNNIYDALKKLPANLNMWSLVVSEEYREQFMDANKTFLYQLVYDPLLRKQVPLNKPDSPDDIVGTVLSDDLAFQLALGNINPFTFKQVDDNDPTMGNSEVNKKTNSWKTKHLAPHKSIWKHEYVPVEMKQKNLKQITRVSTAGLVVNADFSDYFKINTVNNKSDDMDIMKLYQQTPEKQRKSNIVPSTPSPIKQISPPSDISPVLSNVKRPRNPFLKKFDGNSSFHKRLRTSAGTLKMFENCGELEESSYFADKTKQNDLLVVEPKESVDNVEEISLSQQENSSLVVNKMKRLSECEESEDSGVVCSFTQASSSPIKTSPPNTISSTTKNKQKPPRQQSLLSFFGFKPK